MKKYENYSSNLRVLAQASKQDLTNDFIISGVIDKFFIQFELGWKLMKELIGYCGLDCETCEARIAIINDDNELRTKVSKLWSERMI